MINNNAEKLGEVTIKKIIFSNGSTISTSSINKCIIQYYR